MPGNPYYQSNHWKNLRTACLARDGGRCVVPGCGAPANTADHIQTRSPSRYPTPEDRLDNLRSLCGTHDAQVKETRAGLQTRRNGGRFTIRGTGADGWPLDPARR